MEPGLRSGDARNVAMGSVSRSAWRVLFQGLAQGSLNGLFDLAAKGDGGEGQTPLDSRGFLFNRQLARDVEPIRPQRKRMHEINPFTLDRLDLILVLLANLIQEPLELLDRLLFSKFVTDFRVKAGHGTAPLLCSETYGPRMATLLR